MILKDKNRIKDTHHKFSISAHNTKVKMNNGYVEIFKCRDDQC